MKLLASAWSQRKGQSRRAVTGGMHRSRRQRAAGGVAKQFQAGQGQHRRYSQERWVSRESFKVRVGLSEGLKTRAPRQDPHLSKAGNDNEDDNRHVSDRDDLRTTVISQRPAAQLTD